MADNPNLKTVYHKVDGAAAMYPVDANHAVALHPAEWSFEPWPSDGGSVEIPEDWQELSVPKRRALAMQLGAPRTVNASEADEKIAAEMVRRKSAAEAG